MARPLDFLAEAGMANLALSLASGAHLASAGALGNAASIDFLGYGVSLVLFVLGPRHLGAAWTGAYFSMARFIGTAVAVAMFDEGVTTRLVGVGVLMGDWSLSAPFGGARARALRDR